MESKIDPKDAVAIALSGQMAGILGIDKEWKAVTPYDSWLDTRCEVYIDYICENYIDLVLDIVGVPPSVAHGAKIFGGKVKGHLYLIRSTNLQCPRCTLQVNSPDSKEMMHSSIIRT